MLRMRYLYLALVLIVYSCTESGDEREVSTTEQVEYAGENLIEDSSITIKKDTIKTDTSSAFQITGKAIVFFYPSQEEYNKLAEEEGEDSGINEVADDFAYYANEVIDSLKSSDIKTYSTTKPVIIVNYASKSKIVDRRKLDHIVGAVFTDGVKEPQIYTGVYTDIDYWQLVKEYFK